MRRTTSEPPELPGYTFVKVLGSGGFSDVYLYDQKLPKRRVAVKVLLTDELSGANRASFVAEANLMAQLSTHPYIVTIYQADVASDDRPYFVMEYCSGPSLAERYKQHQFDVADALRTGVRLSSAVATAHSAGILHRDIKPANVLTNDYGWPALTDFGISSAVDEDLLPVHTGTLADALHGSTGSTESQSVGMSIPWSPPEMFQDDPMPDVRSDVFSLAATIYTILAGQTPFEVRGRSNGTLDLIGRIERGAITPISRDDVPRSLIAVLQRGMASDRTERYASAVDFARALQRVELELGYAPTPIDVPNLDVPNRDGNDPQSSGSARPDDADETRARTVATIAVQEPGSSGAAEQFRPPLVSPPGEPGILPGLAPGPADGDGDSGDGDSADRDGGDRESAGALDSTRLRSPITVHQTEPAQGDSPDQGQAIGQTVLRPRTPRAQSPRAQSPRAQSPVAGQSDSAAGQSDSAGRSPAREPRLRRTLIASAVIVIVLVIAAIVVVPKLTAGTASPSDNRPSTGSSGGAIDVSSVPTPVLVSAVPSADGTAVTFTWSNPKPKDGDTYLWAAAETPAKRTPVTEPTVVITGVTPGSKVCINVEVLRDGTTSANPLAACTP
jgi:serine/threonine protein kinase